MGKKILGIGSKRVVSTDSTDNPKLIAKRLKDGRESLYLEYYLGYDRVYDEDSDNVVAKKKREYESLHLYLIASPRTPIEREENNQTLELAKKVRFERGQELLESEEGYRLKKDNKIDFYDYYQKYMDNYTKKDLKNIRLAFVRFKSFIAETPEYSFYKSNIKVQNINHDMMENFAEYLKEHSVGEGGLTLWKRFKKVMKYATEHDIFRKNPCDGISIRVDEESLKKDILSEDEISALMAAHCKQENPEIRRAFIFCLYCGLRFCDVKELTFANVDYSNRLLKFDQNKTTGHSSSSNVVIPLNDNILFLIGKKGKDATDDLIFHLPSHTMCLKALRNWTKKAGIEKHITWHCARHSFAVNILNNGANIKTVANLLGHSSIRHTEKYTRAIDELKKAAIDSLPELTKDCIKVD